MKENENGIGYYSVIPATVLYNKELKANEKLLYAIIISLASKEGYGHIYTSKNGQAIHQNTEDNNITNKKGEKNCNSGYKGRDYTEEFLNQFYANLN